MGEVDVEPVQCRHRLRVAVQQGFARAPVIALGPVAAQVLQPGQRHALTPVVDGFRLGPTGVAQAQPQVVQHGVVNVDAVGAEQVAHWTNTPNSSSNELDSVAGYADGLGVQT